MKIALVGSAPASCRLAPYGDPEWQIYGCSPGLYGIAPRVTEWFETHLWEPGQTWFSPEYCQWLAGLPKRGVKLWMGAPDPQSPGYGAAPLEGAEVPPWKEWLEEFDPNRFFCSSSLFWMMARAIKAGASTIGFWGVDMAAGEEYEMQRAGIHHLTYIARSRGIEVGIPPESDLFTPRFAYGFDEWTHSFRKLRMRRLEMEQRMRDAESQARAMQDGAHFLRGALENLEYCHQTWADKSTHCGPRAIPTSEIAPAPREFRPLQEV